MEVGTRVRVKSSVVIYHHPEHKNQAFNLEGHEGEVVAIVNQWHGRPVSANFPYLVQFGPKLKVHLCDYELEAL